MDAKIMMRNARKRLSHYRLQNCRNSLHFLTPTPVFQLIISCKPILYLSLTSPSHFSSHTSSKYNPIIYNNYKSIQSMNYQQLTLSPPKHIARHISQNQYFRPKQMSHMDRHHRLSEPRGKMTLVKINKNKLPGDFFQKKENRRISEQKIYFPEQSTEPLLHSKKIQSERFIYSPEKTSFFGLLQEKRSENVLKMNGPFTILNRKFETRQQAKRDLFGVESYRKVSTTSKVAKRNFLELFPPTYDEKMSEIINESSKVHLMRNTPKKELTPIQREHHLMIDPEKTQQSSEDYKLSSARKIKDYSMKVASTILEAESNDCMNITFYNAKSNCLPPINRQNI